MNLNRYRIILLAILVGFHMGGAKASDASDWDNFVDVATGKNLFEDGCAEQHVSRSDIKTAVDTNTIAERYNATSFAAAIRKNKARYFFKAIFENVNENTLNKFAEHAFGLFNEIDATNLSNLAWLIKEYPVFREKLRESIVLRLVEIAKFNGQQFIADFATLDDKFRNLVVSMNETMMRELLEMPFYAAQNRQLLENLVEKDLDAATVFAKTFTAQENFLDSIDGIKFFFSLLKVVPSLAHVATEWQPSTINNLDDVEEGKALLKAILNILLSHDENSSKRLLTDIFFNNPSYKKPDQGLVFLHSLITKDEEYASILVHHTGKDMSKLCRTREGRALVKHLVERDGDHLVRLAGFIDVNTVLAHGEWGIDVLKTLAQSKPCILEYFRSLYTDPCTKTRSSKYRQVVKLPGGAKFVQYLDEPAIK